MLQLHAVAKRLLLATMFVGVAACSGSEGPAGPEGPVGPAGPTGSANVRQFTFGAFTHSGVEINRDIPVTTAEAADALMYVYVRTAGGFWYPIPGSVTSSFEYRLYFSNPTAATTRVYVSRLSGAGDQAFTAMRVLVVAAASSTPLALDWSDYNAVAAHFGISD